MLIKWIKEKYYMWLYDITKKKMKQGKMRYSILKLSKLRFKIDKQFKEDKRYYELLKFATKSKGDKC